MERSIKIEWTLIFIVLITWFVAPVISIGVILFLIKKFQLSKFTNILFIFLISSSIGLIAYTQKGNIGLTMETDIVRYYALYDRFSQTSFREFIDEYFLTTPNILFDATTFLLSKVFPTNHQIFSLFWVTLSYFFSINATIKITRLIDSRRTAIISSIVLMLFTFSFFTFQTDLIKQSISFALFYYALSCDLTGEEIKSRISLISACLLHTTAFFLIPVLILPKIKRKRTILFFAIIFILLIVSLNNLEILLKAFNFISSITSGVNYFALIVAKALYLNENTDVIDHWRINKLHILIYIVVGIILLLGTCSKKKYSMPENIDRLFKISLFSYSLLLITLTNTHTHLRLLNMYSTFFFIPLMILNYGIKIDRLSKNALKFSYILIFTFFNWFYLYNRTVKPGIIYGSSFMNNSFTELIFSSVPTFLLFNT